MITERHLFWIALTMIALAVVVTGSLETPH